jgi:hypothetical protein
MTKEELYKWDFPVPQGGSSKTPKTVLNWKPDEYETLADLAKQEDEWALNEVLGKGWKDTPQTGYLKPAIKRGDKITIYRAADTGDIIPGAYVSESLKYVQEHGERHIPGGKFKIYQRDVYPDELMSYNDPHEFIYIPKDVEGYHKEEVKKAMAQGKHIPMKVLKDYADLYEGKKTKGAWAQKRAYHGSRGAVNVSELKTVNDSFNFMGFTNVPTVRHGVFLTDNPKFAKSYGDNVMEIGIETKGLADLNDGYLQSKFTKSLDPYKERDLWIQASNTRKPWLLFENKLGERFKHYLQDKGYKGAKFVEYTVDDNDKELKGNTYVVFDNSDLNTYTRKGKSGTWAKETVYHGGRDIGDEGTLEFGMAGRVGSGQDAGAIFVTPSKKYAQAYVKPEGKLYGTNIDLDKEKIFDATNPAHLNKLRSLTNDQTVELIKDSISHGAADWATLSQFTDEINEAGYTGAKFLERPAENITELHDGSFKLEGKPVYSYGLFHELPVKYAPMPSQRATVSHRKVKGHPARAGRVR